ncbi:beta-galactosidase [Paractinoplanes rishiriensis]|uniref:Beta-galactosidase n=2 Tax=Paractinoplanes rishiriensis TaxID=1050105 RepID=A0A919K2K1_9ACTN|nr:beta-galactosidase [Actinoplanes rishiriensis]
MFYGGDYNPEQWGPEVWAEDVRLMREARVNLVTVGVFAWSALEPSDGTFDFGWLDAVMDLLAGNDIAVSLATPNASPPPWLAEAHPESLMVGRDGTRVGVGSRGHFCPSAPAYRDRSLRFARTLAGRYASHPALALWHVGNEYHAECFCDLCDERFRQWLRDRYGTLDELNDRWGTLMWGQRYSDWSQVHLPRPVRGRVNPARELDFSRFNSDVQLDLYKAERDALREATPDLPITTNLMQYFRLNDYRKWAPELDVIAYDSYPDPAQPAALADAALQYDLMRTLGGGAPWLLMEQAAGAVSQWPLNLVKPPGRMRLGSYQAVARGSDAVMFFQWRASRYGQEKFHSAMLPHSGRSSRTWKEVSALGAELAALDRISGARTEARVAIVWDWPNWWAVEGCYHPRHDFSYKDTVTAQYRALWRRNVPVDVVSLDDDLSGYRALIIPNQYAITDAQRAAVRAFAEGGGHVLISFFSGIVDENDRVHPDGYPGGLRDVIGGHVRDFSPMPDGATVEVDGFGTGSCWQDDLVAETAKPLAAYPDGRPAILDHALGAGSVVYLGTRLDEAGFDRVLGTVLDRAAAGPAHPAPDGVEAAVRQTATHRYLFLLNHTDSPVTVRLDRAGHDLLTGRDHRAGDPLPLDAAGVAVLEQDLS